MHKEHHVNNAKAIVGILVLGVAFVLFIKFMSNQDYFFDDIEALRNYVVFTIAVSGFLVGLLYLTSQTKHKPAKSTKAASKTKTVKSSKSSKKKK